MKTAIIIVRVLLGLIFIYASVLFFFKLSPETVSVGYAKVFEVGLLASTYLIPLAKIMELLCGIAFLTGKYVTLANVVIFPVTINILFISLFMNPDNIPIAIFVFLGNIFLIYSYWNNYKSLFVV